MGVLPVMKRSLSRGTVGLIAFLAGSLVLTGCGESGPDRYEVTGRVLVDGRPAERVMVQLHHQDGSVEGNDRYPLALTGADGRFTIGEASQAAGAIAGKYRVTFSWLSSSGLDAVDLFEGAYADVKTSAYTLEVPSEDELKYELRSTKASGTE